jgi:co-chaperonin GroES (HSP10)
MIPIRNNVLLKPFPSDEMSTGGIIIAESYREASNKMEVIAVGSKAKFKEGQTVYRVKDWGDEILIDGQVHFLMSDDSIIATE